MNAAFVYLQIWNVSPRHSLALLCVEAQYRAHYFRFWMQDSKHIYQAPHYPLITGLSVSESKPLIDAQCSHARSLSAFLEFLSRIKEGTIHFRISHRDVACKQKSVLRDATLREVSRNLLLFLSELQSRQQVKPCQKLLEKKFKFESAPFYVDQAKSPTQDKEKSLAFVQLLAAYEKPNIHFINFICHKSQKVKQSTSISFTTDVCESKVISLFKSKPFSVYPCAPPFATRKSLLSYLKFLHSQQRVLASSLCFYHSHDPSLTQRDIGYVETHVIQNCAACKPFLSTFA